MRSMRVIAAERVGIVVVALAGLAQAAPPQYTVTDITGWTPTQQATLPFFKHYRPGAIPIANAPTDFHVVSRTSSGLIVGNTWNVFTGPDQRGVLLSSTTVSIIDSWGDFHWWRTTPPAAATYRLTNALDINWAGTVVGWANLPGTSQTSQEGPDFHAITFDPVTGKTDILPDARYGYANCINNRGDIAGYAYGGPGLVVGGFRRSHDGQITPLDPVPPGYNVEPLWINAQGVVIGRSVPGGWASAQGTTTQLLPKLFGMPLATVTDINDADGGWIVGISEQWDHTEQYATIWEPNANGTWTARDLTNQLANSTILLDRALAINNSGQIIAVGHTDTATPTYGTFLLSPTSSASTTCAPDIGVHPVSVSSCPGNAFFSVTVVNPADATQYQWRIDGTPILPVDNATATTATLILANATAADSGQYDCVVTGPCGSSTSNAAVLDITPCCPADLDNGSGQGIDDGGVDINDLLYFLGAFEAGSTSADLANGAGQGISDGGVDINDLLFFLEHFEAGC